MMHVVNLWNKNFQKCFTYYKCQMWKQSKTKHQIVGDGFPNSGGRSLNLGGKSHSSGGRSQIRGARTETRRDPAEFNHWYTYSNSTLTKYKSVLVFQVFIQNPQLENSQFTSTEMYCWMDTTNENCRNNAKLHAFRLST